MSKLSLIIEQEYLSDIRGKSFWIATLVTPLLMVAFGVFIAFMADSSDSLSSIAGAGQPDQEDLSGYQILGMMTGMLLTLFLMIYGSQIFNKVKQEKCNRIVEVIATCVSGRTMMLGKVIAVALVGLTQLLVWALLVGILIYGIWIVFSPDMGLDFLWTIRFWTAMGISLLYFIGGYVLYGSLFAAVGAMTDKNNENQEYITILTFLLMATLYIGMFAVDNPGSALSIACEFIPFTSPTVGATCAIAGDSPAWYTVVSLVVLYASAYAALALSGKIYTSSLLLMGKKFSPKDIITFLRSK